MIGKRHWIGNQTTILGKCKTKDDTIVGTGSLLNKDYTIINEDYPLLAGRPAKVVRTGIKRVFSPKTELLVSTLFADSGMDFVVSNEFTDYPEDVVAEM